MTAEATDFSIGTHTHTCKVCGTEKAADFYPDPTYKKGDKGKGVKELQEKLNAAGYDCGKADGDFGKKTEAAVKALETAHGFTADGIAWPGVQKWLTPPEPESGPGPGPKEEDEGGYGWDPPGDISTFSGPSSPPLPGEAADTYETTPKDDNATYIYTAYSKDADGSGLKLGDKAWVEATVTNTGTKPLWIGYYRHSHDTEPIACNPGAKGIWHDGSGKTYYLHLPGESSQWKLEIDREIAEKDLADGYIMDIAEWQAYPQEYFAEDGEVTHSLPDDWPHYGASPYEINLNHPVFVSLGAPSLQLNAFPHSPGAVRIFTGQKLYEQVQLRNNGGRLLHNAEADLYLWDKDTGEYTYSKTFPLMDHVFFPQGSSIHLPDHAWGDCSYPLTPWDLENSIDGATQIAFKGRAWTLDGEVFETDLVSVEFYPYYVKLWAELAETPAAQAPENGFVKAKVRVGNDGSDTFDASTIVTWMYNPVTDTYPMDATAEVHGDEFTWLYEGTSKEFEVRTKPTKEDIQAGEVRRWVDIYFYRWSRNGGRSVYADTPKEEVIGHYEWCHVMYKVEIVIPLLVPETEITPEPEPAPATTQEPVRDTCVRILDGRCDGVAENTLTYCTEHEQLRESTMQAPALAMDEGEKALEAAVEEWRETMDAEYEALLSQLGEENEPAVEAERTAFTELLEARRAMLAQTQPCEDEEVERRVLEMLMHKVAEMCYERHTAPNEREDSLTNAALTELEPVEAAWSCDIFTALVPNGERIRETLCADHRDVERRAGELTADAIHETAVEVWQEVKQLWLGELDDSTRQRYIAADETGRKIIAAEREAYGEWLEARVALLNQLYPDRPAVVQEVLAETIRSRVLEECGD